MSNTCSSIIGAWNVLRMFGANGFGSCDWDHQVVKIVSAASIRHSNLLPFSEKCIDEDIAIKFIAVIWDIGVDMSHYEG